MHRRRRQPVPNSLGLYKVILGRAAFRGLSEDDDPSEAGRYLDEAVESLKQAGRSNFVPVGLLARAELRRLMHELEKACLDVDEAMKIATRGSMRLHEADCHLEYARVYLAQGERDKALSHWVTAGNMIKEDGYHRRDRDLAEIEGQLGEKI